jgi:uncharacterized protein with HEPN domain
MKSDRSSDAPRALERIRHVLERIQKIRRLLDGLTVVQLQEDDDRQAACERYFEVISEASRHVPEPWQVEFGPSIPWRRIAAIGNIIRHAYGKVDIGILWDIYKNDLDALQLALERMIECHGA